MTKEFQIPIQVVANRQVELPLSEAELSAIAELGDTELSKYAGGLASQLKNQTAMMQQLQSSKAMSGPSAMPVQFIPRFLSLMPREMVQAAKEALRDLWTRS